MSDAREPVVVSCCQAQAMSLPTLLALRSMGLAVVAQCDAALATLRHEAEAAPSPVVAAVIESSPACSHPEERQISTAVAGHPQRRKCGVCGETFNGGSAAGMGPGAGLPD